MKNPQVIKKTQVFLLVIILIGLSLIFTQKYWVKSFTNYILNSEKRDLEKVGSRWTNKVKSVRTDCAYDGICSVTVGDIEVIIDQGGRMVRDEEVGKIIGEMANSPIDQFVGKTANVFARRITSDKFTLYGNKDFYIEILK